MWFVWGVAVLSAALVASCMFLLRHDLRSAPRSWQLLACSGIPLVLGGLGFVVRFWKPTAGPYRANEVYPLGPYLNAWAVSFGFMWVAFGLIFFVAAARGPHSGRTWLTLLVAWFLAWLPHGIIGIGFAAAGSNEPSIRLYQQWAANWPGLLRLCTGALILVGHLGLSLLGFGLTGRGLRRGRQWGHSA
jgi:hypothetical protein